MTSSTQIVRLYALAIAVLAFFVAWAVIAVHPWQAGARTRSAEPAVWSPLDALEQRLERDAALVAQLTRGRAAQALPTIVVDEPVTMTRTS